MNATVVAAQAAERHTRARVLVEFWGMVSGSTHIPLEVCGCVQLMCRGNGGTASHLKNHHRHKRALFLKSP